MSRGYMFVRVIVRGVSVQGVYVLVGNRPGGICPCGYMSLWVIVQGVYVLVGNCPGGICPCG